MRHWRAAIFAALSIFIGADVARAQDITLSSRDGSVTMSGNLRSFDGEFYRIETEFGLLTVDASGVACEGPACPDLDHFVSRVAFSGARLMAEDLMPSLLRGFAAQKGYAFAELPPGDGLRIYELRDGDGQVFAEFEFYATSSDAGLADLLAEDADVAMSLREASAEEVAKAGISGLSRLRRPQYGRVIALDGLVPLVAPSNPVRAIPFDQLAAVFAGEIANWQSLGGVDAPIYVHVLPPQSGPMQRFGTQVMGPAKKALSETVVVHESFVDLVAAVRRDPFAIGIGSYATLGSGVALALTGDCGFHAGATPQSLKTEDYPLTAPLFLYMPARRLPAAAREFLAWAQSPEAQPVIAAAGYTDQGLGEVPLREQGDRLANAIANAGPEVSLDELQRFVATLGQSKRLSLSFRFEIGSSALDAQSRSNVLLLARALETGFFDDKPLIFVGFSDGEGPAEVNLRLAKQRARVVRTAVLNAAKTADPGRVTLDTDGFGEALPMACDDSAWGRSLNRRVEVWLR